MRELGRRYGWKPNDIAEMTWPMIMMYLDQEGTTSVGGKQAVQFTGRDAMGQYAQWRRANFGVA